MRIIGQTLSTKDLIHVIPRLLIVIIIGQTLPFKYLGHEESVWIFTQMGWEPWGRYFIAIVETIAMFLLLSGWYIIGAIITLSIISAANFLHFTRLGINVNGDGGLLFSLSVIIIICSLIIVFHWNKMRTQSGVAKFDFEVKLEEEE
ncbi:MAG: DoxX family protein [Bacteroidota bacterium]